MKIRAKYRLQICHIYFYIILTISAIGLFGCSETIDSDSERDYFVYNRFDGVASLDPAFARNQATTWACHHLYNGLVQLDRDLKIKPSIAKSWTINESQTQYTFNLRTDVKFHESDLFTSQDQRLVNASDVVYSLSRIIDPDVASSGAWIFNNKVTEQNPFVALNDSTVQINLVRPFQPLLGILSMQYCSIIPTETENLQNDIRRDAVGTGPFKFQLWEEGEVLLLERNEDYFEMDGSDQQLPYLDGVRVEFIVDKGLEYMKFKQGELDYMSDVDPAFRNDLLTLNGELREDVSEDFNLLKAPYLNTEYIGFLIPSNEHTKSRLLRRAINHGIDREKMLTYIRNDIGEPAVHGMVPIGMPLFNHSKVKGYDYNPAKARQLLEQAGYPNGSGLEPITITTIASYVDWAVSIQNQLAEINIPIKIELVQSAFLRQMMRKSEGLELFRASWIADYPDPENYLSLFYGKNGAPPNYTRFSNSEFDRLYEASTLIGDGNERQSIYEAMDSIVIQEAAVIPLYYDEVLSFSQKSISGMVSHPMNILDLRYVTKSAE